MTEGKCSKKGWSWKKVQDRLLPFQDSDAIGTIHCILEAYSEIGFTKSELSEIQNAYSNSSVSPQKITITIQGTQNKAENIQMYDSFLNFLLRVIKSADKAIVGVKKSPSQIHIVRCGSTSNTNN